VEKQNYYDIKRIQEEATGYNVAEYLGMDIIRRGAYSFILCPGHIDRLGRKDTIMKNCILTNQGYRCFACGVSVNVFTMVMEYYKNELGKEINFPEAVGIVGDSLGGRQHFLLNSSDEYHFSEASGLSSKDYEILGLKPTYSFHGVYNTGKIVNNEELERETLQYQESEETGNFLFYRTEKFSMQHLSQECPELYHIIIEAHAKKAMEKYKGLLKKYCDRNSRYIKRLEKFSKNGLIEEEIISGLKKSFTEKYNRAAEIYNEVSYMKESVTEDSRDIITTILEKKKEIQEKTRKEAFADLYEMFGK